jgi:carbon monoxide dehydrogenase subunit G
MPVIREEIHIRRPVEDVWAYLVDVANTPVWNPMFEHQEVVGGGPMMLGSRFRNVARMLGRRIEAEAEVTRWDPPHASSIRTVGGPIDATGAYLLLEEDGGTRFVWEMDAATGLGGLFGRMADSVVMRRSASTLREGLGNLRNLLEQELEDITGQPRGAR